MLRELTATESNRTELRLDEVEVESLRAIGKELVASRDWWGGDADRRERSVVDVVRLHGDTFGITFRDVVGVVRVGDVQIRIKPKISDAHFLHLISSSLIAPRTADGFTSLGESTSYPDLLANWCVLEAEALLRRGLRRDYTDVAEELSEVRGRLDPIATSLAAFSGRVAAVCEFEDFNDDAALNRVIKAACQMISATPTLDTSVRRRARRIAMRLDLVGPLRHGDRSIRISRLTKDYGRVVPLARLVLEGGGVTTQLGALSGRSFLIRTPELIEDGLRNILGNALALQVRKRRLSLGDSGMTINPDLVFGEAIAVGDIKYRHIHEDWHRPSLYQAISFATGFRSKRCAIFGFSGSGTKVPPEVRVGDVKARCFAWNASPDRSPASSEKQLVCEVEMWLQEG